MKLSMDPVNLNYFEALASATRLEILRLLAGHDRNIKELAQELDISSSIVTKHVRKLESAGLIATRNVSRDGNRNKVCTLLHTVTEIESPQAESQRESERFYSVSLPVGLFSGLNVKFPCGMATTSNVIGSIDNPAHLLLPERGSAQTLWIGEGSLEYLIPNLLNNTYQLTAIEFSGEFGQAVTTDSTPSNISVRLGNCQLCTFSIPAIHGIRSSVPTWWRGSPFGILVQVRVDHNGVYINGERKSEHTISDIAADRDRWTLQLDVEPSGSGLAIFGEQSGSYEQGLELRIYYQ